MSAVPHKLDGQDYERWLHSESGQRLLELQSSWLQHKMSRFFGGHMLYQGIATEVGFMNESGVKHAFRMGLPWQRGVIDAAAWMDSSHWPLADHCLDAMIMQHSLDFTHRPHQMIREAARVIAPSGHIVLIGFNPFSLWGAVQKLLPFSSTMPWVANTVSALRLKDWLALLGFTIHSHETMGYLGPVTLLPRRFCQRVDAVTAGGPVMMGNYYMIIAQKTVAGMTSVHSRRWALPNAQIGWASSISGQSKCELKENMKAIKPMRDA